eukprot:1803974-Prymnesium_polylepis.1
MLHVGDWQIFRVFEPRHGARHCVASVDAPLGLRRSAHSQPRRAPRWAPLKLAIGRAQRCRCLSLNNFRLLHHRLDVVLAARRALAVAKLLAEPASA